MAPTAAVEVAVHGLFEARLEGPDAPDPLDVEAKAEILTPSGRREHVPLFWDGGRVWRLRYSPEAPGGYEYKTTLGGAGGRFSARPGDGATELDREGAPRLAGSRRLFEHVSGKPWFWLADTAWNGALLSAEREWDDYLSARVRQRFTAVQFVLTQWRASYADEQGRKAFRLDDGKVVVDPAFFARMDRRVAAIRAHGLVPVPVMLWALSSKWDESPGGHLDVPQAARLASYLNARYAAYGSLWMLGGDGDYGGEKAQRWREIGRAVFSNVTRRPVTLHPGGMKDPWPGLADEPWIDFFTYQSGHGNDARKWKWQLEEAPKSARLEPPRPIIDAEPNYEAHPSYGRKQTITDYHVRRAAYTSLLSAPVAGVTYGAHGIWPWLRERAVPLNHPGSGEGDPVSVCLRYPGAAQMKILRDILDRVPWWSLRPAPEMIRDNKIDEEYSNAVVAGRAESGREALIYAPKGPSLKLNLADWRAGARGTWIDPRTGAAREPAPLSNAAGLELNLPGEADWVLLIQQ